VKETLTLKKDDFGSTCELSETFLKKITNCGIIQNIIDLANAKESLDLKKKLG
jgi:DNA topoisomerase-2